jgi:hypothetical protein
MPEPVKCACASCFCMVPPGKGVVREGKVYCSETCAYECTEKTCVCIHDRCGDRKR